MSGEPIDFGSAMGSFTMLDVVQTPPETFAIGDSGVSLLEITCALDPTPLAAELPPPPAWTVTKGKVKLGKGGDAVADDKLNLKGIFEPLAGVVDFDAEDVVLSIETDDASLVSLRVPAGSMKANKKETKFSLKDKTGAVVGVNPPLPPETVVKHTFKVKRKKDGSYLVTVASKGLLLDGLNVPELTTRVVYGSQSPSAVDAVTANGKGNKLTF